MCAAHDALDDALDKARTQGRPMTNARICDVCGEHFGGSHYHCGNCGETSSMLGHWIRGTFAVEHGLPESGGFTCEKKDWRPADAPGPWDIEAGTHALREKLASIEHERWAHWQRWMHSQGDVVDGNMCFTAERWQAWERQIDTPYPELSAAEKASDMEQVDRYWPLIEEYINCKLGGKQQ